MPSKNVTVREATFDILRGFGVDKVFGNPGSTEMPFLRDWPADIDYVLGLQESTVVGMADGYAQAKGRPAFVNLHSAAGVGHALGNVFTAFRNKTPMVITAGQQARSLLALRPYLFSEDAPQFPKPYIKWSIEPSRAEDVPGAIMQAFLMALQHPQGPAFVSVPADDWDCLVTPPVIRHVAGEFRPDPAAVARLAAAIDRAERPVFVVGPQVDQSGATAHMVALAERAKAPVWGSPMSPRSSFPERHPLFAGSLLARPAALSAALKDADLIVVCGAPVFLLHIEGRCDVLENGTPIWQITADPIEAASSPVGESLIGTMPATLQALVEALAPATHRADPPKRQLRAVPAAAVPLPPGYVLDRLAQLMPADSIIVEEAPSHRTTMQAFMPRDRPGTFYTMASGGLGYGLPAAVGVSLAKPGTRIICLVGDGSSMYSIQALWTAAQRKLPIIFVIMNNSGYGAMRIFQSTMQAESVPGIDFGGFDFVSLARGFGLEGHHVETPDDLDEALDKSLRSNGPSLVEIVVDSAVVIPGAR